MVSETDTLVRIVVAAALGATLGLEREWSGKTAGLRTHMLVAEGAALFMVGSMLLTQRFQSGGNALSLDPTRVASTIVAGVGFLGGGAILQSRDRVKGITTAADIWVAAAIGMLAGAGLYVVAIGGVAIAIATLTLLKLPERWVDRSHKGSHHLLDEDQEPPPPSATQ
jgi:putative Mg2+ transporter-C (MgtC) family protein